jgi:predicted acetyltransferase
MLHMAGVEPVVRLVVALREDRDVVRHLLEFNAYEFSRFDSADVGRDGRFGYPFLDLYWSEPARRPYLIKVGESVAGLVLIRSGSPHSVAEFLVLPKYRRAGVGRTAARMAFAQFAGEWEIHVAPGNAGALEFWRRAIPVPFDESVGGDGSTQRFSVRT